MSSDLLKRLQEAHPGFEAVAVVHHHRCTTMDTGTFTRSDGVLIHGCNIDLAPPWPVTISLRGPYR